MSASPSAKPVVCLVTGANQGIGYEIVKLLAGDAEKRHWKILLGSRNEANGAKALKELGSPANVSNFLLDVTDAKSIEAAVQRIKKEYTQLDVLIQNAGIAFMDRDYAHCEATLKCNLYGVKAMNDSFLPIIPERTGRIILVSSEVGAWAHHDSPAATQKALHPVDNLQWKDVQAWADKYLESFKPEGKNKELFSQHPMIGGSYCTSKMFESVYGRILARDLKSKGIPVALVTPGYCRTNLGPQNKNAPRSAEQGAHSCLYGLKVAAGDSTLYHDGTEVPVMAPIPAQYSQPLRDIMAPIPAGDKH